MSQKGQKCLDPFKFEVKLLQSCAIWSTQNTALVMKHS